MGAGGAQWRCGQHCSPALLVSAGMGELPLRLTPGQVDPPTLYALASTVLQLHVETGGPLKWGL